MDKRNKNIWIYNSGNTFSGNPKWMFMYMRKEHPEIKGIWLCYDRKTCSYIRRLGYPAYLYYSSRGKQFMKKAGVYVVNQVKEVIQPELKGITMLNLWHGVGCKTIEQKVDFGFLQERIFKKYIHNNKFYRNNQLFLVTSPLMEEHFIKQCGLKREQLIRSNYPCCVPMDYVKSYDHDVRKQKGLGSDSKIIMYCPTYRDGNACDFFGKAIPDMERLIERLKEKNCLLIFKMHPQMDKDYEYNRCRKLYGNCPNLMFWDNVNDVYEIFSQVDTAIIDYSSMFYDMLSAGVRHFIRYMFDIDDKNNLRDFVFDVKEMTCGVMCDSFDSLIDAIGNDNTAASDEDYKRIRELFWQYADENSIEEIYNRAMEFEPADNPEDKVLYSFDIFDTLIQRKCLSPAGIFVYVKQKMYKSTVLFPKFLMENYKEIRAWCESNVREYYRKTLELREDNRLEITFDEIFDRMAEVYKLSEEQISLLKEWELEAEYDACIPYKEHIDILKKLYSDGEQIVLISDMYLSEDFVRKMLHKADPVFDNIPLFLSSTYGVQKSTKQLYLKVFSYFDNYDFTEWIHYGDNPHADCKMPQQLGIKTINHNISKWYPYEQKYLTPNGSYDAYRCGALFTRFKDEYGTDHMTERFVYCYVSTWLVPYVAWAVNDAIENDVKCLYFISRDGYHLKRIADAIIEVKGLRIKTKYIYGSRRAWRIPSYIDRIDKDFFTTHGNISEVRDYTSLLEALHLTDEEFDEIFPTLAYLKNSKIILGRQLEEIRNIAENSRKYSDCILAKSKEERGIVLEYLRQEIDFKEKYAFVEYWGRGYTQDCLIRLLDEAAKDVSGRLPDYYDLNNVFYYMRSIYFDNDRIIRRNFINAPLSLIMVEAVFANMPYKSVEGYRYSDDTNKIVPVIVDNPYCDKKLFDAMEKLLPQFAREMYSQALVDEEEFNQALAYFGLKYYKTNIGDAVFSEVLAKLKDSVSIYGTVSDFAPPLNWHDVYMKLRYGEYLRTRSLPLSLKRSNTFFRYMHKEYTKWKQRRKK